MGSLSARDNGTRVERYRNAIEFGVNYASRYELTSRTIADSRALSDTLSVLQRAIPGAPFVEVDRARSSVVGCIGDQVSLRMTANAPTAIPSGFKLMLPNDGFMQNNGPYYLRRLEEGGYAYGFQSDGRHGNPNNVLHGGAVIGFLDTIMGHFAASSAKRPTATIGFDCRFLTSTQPGAWIEGRVIMRRLTRTLAFVDGEALAGDKLLVTASGIFKVFEG